MNDTRVLETKNILAFPKTFFTENNIKDIYGNVEIHEGAVIYSTEKAVQEDRLGFYIEGCGFTNPLEGYEIETIEATYLIEKKAI